MSRLLFRPFAKSTKTVQIPWLLSHSARHSHDTPHQQSHGSQVAGDYVPSSSILKVARSANIGFPTRWSTLKIRAPPSKGGKTRPAAAAQVAVMERHVFHPWHTRYLDQHGHALAESMLKRYLAKTDPLWWFAVVYPDSTIADTVFVKKTMAKKAKRAFRAALRRRGWDEKGRRIPGHEFTPQDRPQLQELYGTVRIIGMLKTLLHLPSEEVVGFMEQVVKVLEERLGRPRDVRASKDMATSLSRPREGKAKRVRPPSGQDKSKSRSMREEAGFV